MSSALDPGSLSDVAGVLVGHQQRIGRGWQTGTTVVHVPAGAVCAVDVRGGGPGTRETDALAPGNLVDRVHAICLSGGSAYGLSAADGVMTELERLGLGVPVGDDPAHVVPVVPTAVIFDLGRGGRFDARPGPDFGARAFRATKRTSRRGVIGAGTGAQAGGLQGGVGMASALVTVADVTVRVGALAVVNAAGCVVDPRSGAPWVDHPAVKRPSADDRRAWRSWVHEQTAERQSLNTTIGVVATDASLDRAEAGRIAMAAHDGLARAIRPAHALTDGDTVFALTTGDRPLPDDHDGLVRTATSRVQYLNAIAAASAEVFSLACTDAIVSAATVGAAPAYLDLCPGARRT